MVLTQQRNVVTRTWGTSAGKKFVMAATGAVFLLYVVVHMIGKLKIFAGPQTTNAYSIALRSVGQELIGYGTFVTVVRVVLIAAVVVHMWAAFSLWRRARRARPVGYQRRGKLQGSYAARTMRWGGVILALFIIWHILDITTADVNPVSYEAGTYARVVASFERPVVAVFYILAVVALGFHVRHGLWSAVQTLGQNSAVKQNALKTGSFLVAAAVTVGFAIVPLSVMFGLVT